MFAHLGITMLGVTYIKYFSFQVGSNCALPLGGSYSAQVTEWPFLALFFPSQFVS